MKSIFPNKMALLSTVVVAMFVMWAGLGPLFLQEEPTRVNISERFSPPNLKHLLGTDQLGRDVLVRLTYGARLSLIVSLCAVLFAAFCGSTLGLLAGYYGGGIDNAIMRFLDIMFSLPSLVLAITLVAFLGNSVSNVVIAIGIVYSPQIARVIRSNALKIRSEEYILAAKAIGCGNLRIIVMHVFRNIAPTLLALSTLYIGSAIIYEATLSFLGMGVPLQVQSWGKMLAEARGYLALAPWMALAPGLAIMFVVMSFNFLGDQLRDMLDPKLRGGI